MQTEILFYAMDEDQDILDLFPAHEVEMNFKEFELVKENPEAARALLPKEHYKNIQIPNSFDVPFHPHTLRVSDGRHWGCDGRHNAWGCLSINDDVNYKELGRWRCENCDYDLCRSCIEQEVFFKKVYDGEIRKLVAEKPAIK